MSEKIFTRTNTVEQATADGRVKKTGLNPDHRTNNDSKDK